MRTLFSFAFTFAPLAFATTAATQVNPFLVFPQDPQRQAPITCSGFVRRPDFVAAAEGLLEINAAHFRGVGDEGDTCRVRGFYHWAADENLATPETYDLVIRSAAAGGGPDTTPAGLLLSVPGLGLPTSTAGPPRGTWIVTEFFATPFAVPCNGTWFIGVSFPAKPAFPADGHSQWAADVPGFDTATVGENPRNGAPRLYWSVNPTTGAAAARPWMTLQGPILLQPVLHVGGNDPQSMRQGATGGPNLGLGGLFPEIRGPRRDGIALRVQDSFLPNGVGFFAGAFGFEPAPFPVGTFFGRVHLDLGSAVMLGFVQLTNGAGTLVVAGPNTISPALVGVTAMFQAAVTNPLTGSVAFSNAQATHL